ncbi:MAG TPA: YegS/Rv2252/BmrU family lipid kinase [Nocardioidaceae bacterium]|nr:YegS/Rv2252/BmrU family lipid kinase [Nocardioidaceae bacterium]
MRSALLIANKAAGSSDQASIQAAVERLEHEGVGLEVAATEDPADLDVALDRRGTRDVIVVGGDGSLHAVVAALAGRQELDQLTLGLIPLGTGNDFARSVGVPLEPTAAAVVCASGAAHALDIIVDDEGGIVVNAANLGIGAEASRHASDLKPRLGRVAYPIGALAAGVSTKGLRLRVEADGVVVADGSARVLQVGVGNGPFVGGGTPLTPRARPSDGQIDVVVSFAVGPLRRLAYAIQVKLGRHLDRRDVLWVRAKAVRVSGEEYWCSSDGEQSGPLTDRTWSVLPRALRMALPSESDI